MPTLDLPQVPHYVHAPVTDLNLDYADLPIIDLSKAATFEGRSALAIQVRDAMLDHGFFYVINHGYTTTQSERIFDIANVPFQYVSHEEKTVYAGTMKQSGSYQGYKLRQYWHIDGGVYDQLEMYNGLPLERTSVYIKTVNRDVNKREHPHTLRPLLPEIEEFARHNHLNVLHPILRLLALGLELPEETFVKIHGFDAVGETYGVILSLTRDGHYPRSEDEEAKSKNVWLKGHTDFGTITILYSQPVAGLQILTPSGDWKWVKHIDNALVVNAGDAMEFLSGGFYRATIHRVIQPPQDQRQATRLGVFYFCLSDDHIKLAPFVDSPVLQQRVGIRRRFENDAAPTMEEWRKGRTSNYGQSELKVSEGNVEEETIAGVVVKHYN
ncbi:hypothetical protein H0H93_012733 [Arthromyces matolae]|nr:hypothetical protein H0H93_012733 [Arthromyces matolae]